MLIRFESTICLGTVAPILIGGIDNRHQLFSLTISGPVGTQLLIVIPLSANLH